MSNHSPTPATARNTELTRQAERRIYEAASDRVRRYVLAIVLERDRPVGMDELATRVAAWRHEKPLRRVTDEEHRRALAALHHAHLPKLEEVDLVGRDSDGRVGATNRSLVRRAGLVDDLHAAYEDDEDPMTRFFELLSEPTRRSLLADLQGRPEEDFPLGIETIAEALVERTGPDRDAGPAGCTGEHLVLSLHHRHLPKLAEAGVVTYDRDERTVSFEGHPALRREWR